ncbi:MAG TPA: FAD-dependent oxidoreductase [Gammaproteobacteria bacterium]|nr:FAD-dependent oxidoreductase [Gammaproteobacteria bacterium]
MNEQHVAVIGGGIAGLGAAWLLSPRYRVTLVEANDYVGGHTHTVDCPVEEGSVPVDTGFIVYNEPNYPNLAALFRHLGIKTHESDMSFAFAARDVDIEYAGDNVNTLFGQRRNLVRPVFWRMLADVIRFNRDANRRLDTGMREDLTLGELLDELRLGTAFRRYHLLPMSAAIWSCPQQRILDFPAERFLRFFRNHGLTQLTNRPQWRTVVGGGREYVRRMLSAVHEVLIDTPVTRLERTDDGVVVRSHAGEVGRFDQVVVAAHADQALAMIDTPTFREQKVLGAFRYERNDAWLHGDPGLMPRRRRLWASWNHLTDRAGGGDWPVSVTYWMNRLQQLQTRSNVFVTLNPLDPPDASLVYRRMSYEHPVFDGDAIRAQRLLPTIQGRDRLWFCGSYCGYGFHEDALGAAVGVAERLGAPAPWSGVGAVEPPAEPAGILAETGALS